MVRCNKKHNSTPSKLEGVAEGRGRVSALREVTTLLSGSVVAQAIAFAAYFVLLRIYTAEDYGLFSIFYSYIEVIIIFSTCKYELAIVPAATDQEAAAIGRYALKLNAIVSAALLAILTVLTLTGTLPGKFSRLGSLALLIAPMVFFCGTTRIYGELFNRRRNYRTIAASDVAGAGIGALLKTLFGLIGMHTAGMPLGTVLGQASANLVYRLRLGGKRSMDGVQRDRQATDSCSLTDKEVARRNRNFPLYVAPKDLLNSLSANLPFIWLALYFDNAAVGFFGIAITFIIRPTQVISASFERMLNARCSEAVRCNSAMYPMLRRFLLPTVGVALLGAALLWFISGPLFGLLFGGRWTDCAPYVRALLPWAVANIASLPLMFIPNIFGTQRIELLLNIARLLLRVAAIAVGIAMSDFLLAVWLFSAASTIPALILFVWYLSQARHHDQRLV